MESIFKGNYFHFICPRFIDFESLHAYTNQEKQKCLESLCKSAIDVPIIKDDVVIGVIKDCHIAKGGDRLVYGGIIWDNVLQEIIVGKDNKPKISSIILNKNGDINNGR